MLLGIKLTVDFAFKRIFGSPEYSEALIALLNAILVMASPIVTVEILNPFSYQEFEVFLKNEKITHNAKELKDFIFKKLEQKELIQYYASKEWMEAMRHPKFNPPGGSEFTGDGSIWFLVNKTENAK